MKRLFILFLCLGLALLFPGCSSQPDSTQATAPVSPDVTDTQSVSPEPSPSPEVSPDVPAVDSPEPEPSPEPDPGPEFPVYEFGTPLAETEPVEDAHFENAAFLGDSRTEGLQLFGGLHSGDYYWARGMTVFRVDDPNYAIFEVNGEMVTMMGALRAKEYDSVYIMVGVNELGYDAAIYENGLNTFLDLVLEAQPNAVVYLQILPPVNETLVRQNGLGDYINNNNIARFNEAIVRVAAEKKVVLLDTAEVYRDENGELPAELASDGCHFTFSGYSRWADYLRCHVMDPETYHYNRALEAEPAPEPSVEPEPSESPAAETEQEDPEP